MFAKAELNENTNGSPIISKVGDKHVGLTSNSCMSSPGKYSSIVNQLTEVSDAGLVRESNSTLQNVVTEDNCENIETVVIPTKNLPTFGKETFGNIKKVSKKAESIEQDRVREASDDEIIDCDEEEKDLIKTLID